MPKRTGLLTRLGEISVCVCVFLYLWFVCQAHRSPVQWDCPVWETRGPAGTSSICVFSTWNQSEHWIHVSAVMVITLTPVYSVTRCYGVTLKHSRYGRQCRRRRFGWLKCHKISGVTYWNHVLHQHYQDYRMSLWYSRILWWFYYSLL